MGSSTRRSCLCGGWTFAAGTPSTVSARLTCRRQTRCSTRWRQAVRCDGDFEASFHVPAHFCMCGHVCLCVCPMPRVWGFALLFICVYSTCLPVSSSCLVSC